MIVKTTTSVICAVALTGACYARSNLGVLSESDGQRMVLGEFSNCAFEKGAFGNEDSLLLPFYWIIPNKGIYTYFSAADQKYSDGISWELMQVTDGRMIHCEYKWMQETDVWFQPFQLFEVAFADDRSLFVYHNDHFQKISPYGAIIDIKWFNLCISTNGTPMKTQLPDGIGSLFANERVKTIRNVVPYRYRGPKADVVKMPTREKKRLTDGRGTWELSGISKSLLVDMHRKYVETASPPVVVTNIFIIACDGNFDGMVDAYMSSDAERVGEEKFRWTLYIKESSGLFVRFEKPQTFLVDDIEMINIDPELHASRGAFFMINRIGVPSYVMPIVVGNGKPELWSYAKHKGVVQSFRQKNGMENADFSSCIDAGKLGALKGIASLKDIFLMHSMLVSAMRLPCEVIAVPGKANSE